MAFRTPLPLAEATLHIATHLRYSSMTSFCSPVRAMMCDAKVGSWRGGFQRLREADLHSHVVLIQAPTYNL